MTSGEGTAAGREQRVREATYRVAAAALACDTLTELFERIHAAVSGLMEARNFYIALHDSASGALSFPYYRDEQEPEPPPPHPLGRGLTEYVLRTARPLLADPDSFHALREAGEVELVGPDGVDWLGVPLVVDGVALGVLAVQSYSGQVRYTEADRDLLVFVSTQVALAVERRRAEEALRASEERHRAILEALPDILFVLHRDGRYLAVHSHEADKLARPREVLLRTRVQDVLPPDVADFWLGEMARCLSDREPRAFEYELDVPAGRRAFEGRLVPHGPHAVLALVRDVTDRLRSQKALLAADAELRRLTDNMVDVISQTDLAGVFQFVSPSHRLAAGWGPEELIGRKAVELIHPDDRELVKQRLGREVLENGSGRAEYRYLHRNGRFLWVETVGNLLLGSDRSPQGYVYGTREVTDRKRAETVVGLLHEVDRKILGREPLEGIFGFLCSELCLRFDYPLVWIGTREDDGSVRLRSAKGSAAAYVEGLLVRWDDTPEGQGPAGVSIRTARPFVVEPAKISAPGLAAFRDRALAHGLRAALSVPLVSDEQVRGVLVIYAGQPETFDEKTVSLLARFGDQLALSLVAASQLSRIELQTAALEAAANAVVITDREGKIEWVNPAFTELTGYSKEEVVHLTPRILKSGVQSDFYYEQLWQTILTGNVWRGELYNARKDGTVYVEEQTITPVKGPDGAIHHFISIKQDVTARRRTEERIRYLALHDPLTDLPNRRALEASLERIIARARRGTPSTLLLLDLDNFKVVNDSVGHPSGDRVLVDLARLLLADLRPGDEVARLGGDEFVILLEGIPLEVGRLTAERLRRLVDGHSFVVGEKSFDLGISIGVVPIDGRLDAAAVLSVADSALYAAKDRGRNRVVVFDSSAWRKMAVSETSEWASKVKEGLRDGGLLLHYQPIFRIETGKAVHYEALVRLAGPDGQVVPPSRFLGAAEKFGLMPQLDRWVVGQVLAVLKARPELEIFVNLSGASLGHEELIGEIEELVRGSGVGPGRLAFEITETSAVSDLGAVTQWMRRLKDLGCRFALDDFGIGFSSFGYLQSLPADYVKIDGSFIRDLDANPSNRALVKAIDTVAHTLGKETIAESVESAASLALLRELGVEFAQGYALGRPSPILP